MSDNTISDETISMNIFKIIEECISLSVTTMNISQLFNKVLKKISTVLDFDYAFVGELKHDLSRKQFYRYHSFYGFDKLPNNSPIKKYYLKEIEKTGGYFDFKNMLSIHGKLVEGGEGGESVDKVHIDDILKICKTPFPTGHPAIKSFISFKLKHPDGSVVGVIAFGCVKGGFFNERFEKKVNMILPFLASIFVNIRQKESINKHKDAFLANMSHEVRTPLHGIVSLTKLLVKTKLDEEQQEYVNIISQCSVQLLDIVNDILDYASINTGKMKFINAPVELRQCVENARDLVLIKQISTGGENGVPINVTLAENLPEVIITDKTRICQVLVNIIGNAYKFTASGEINVKGQLMANNDVNNECEIYFTVADTGIGIPEDKIDSVFDSFQQLSNNVFENNTGVGLGLPISKYIVNKMGGKIWIDSKVGNGSIVHFTIKCGVYINKIDINKLKKYYSGRNFIIIDNDTNDKTVTFNTLLKLGAKPILCLNVKEAIMYINSNVFVVEYMIINIDTLTDSEIECINSLKNDITKVVLLSNTVKNKLDSVKHHYTVRKPITTDKLYKTCNLIYEREKRDYNDKRQLFLKKDSLGQSSDSIDSPDSSNSIEDKKIIKIIKRKGEKDRRRDNKLSLLDGSNLTTVHSKIGQSINILVTEDIENNKIVITKLLQKLGYYNIKYAGNGVEMIKAIHNEQFHIVFVDLKMPIMDGVTATKKVKADMKDSDLPMLVALTASITDETRKMCFNVGMKGFLTKPVEIDDLETIMSIAVKKAASVIY